MGQNRFARHGGIPSNEGTERRGRKLRNLNFMQMRAKFACRLLSNLPKNKRALSFTLEVNCSGDMSVDVKICVEFSGILQFQIPILQDYRRTKMNCCLTKPHVKC